MRGSLRKEKVVCAQRVLCQRFWSAYQRPVFVYPVLLWRVRLVGLAPLLTLRATLDASNEPVETLEQSLTLKRRCLLYGPLRRGAKRRVGRLLVIVVGDMAAVYLRFSCPLTCLSLIPGNPIPSEIC